jgi:hypothetical protein
MQRVADAMLEFGVLSSKFEISTMIQPEQGEIMK